MQNDVRESLGRSIDTIERADKKKAVQKRKQEESDRT